MHIVCAFCDFYLGIRKNAVTLLSTSRFGDAISHIAMRRNTGDTTIESRKMNEHTKRQSAQILQFPIGGRSGLSSHRGSDQNALDFSDVGYDRVSFGGCWYHDEAVTAGDQTREH